MNHTFTNLTTDPEEFTVTLTATRASIDFTDTATVTVMPATGVGLGVTITNGASGLAGAAVTVVDAHGVRYDAVTNASGLGTVYGLPNGAYTVYVYADGYQPATKSVTVANGTGSTTIVLTTGAVGSAVLDSTRLSYDQIIAAGIDPSDPANQNVVHFTICLAFDGAVCNVTVDADTNSDGTLYNGGVGGPGITGGGGCTSAACDFTLPDGREVQGTVTMVGNEPVMNFLLISGEARWLKEFFEVKMLIVNLAPAGFTFTGGNATISLPDGLSLAPTAAPQSPSIDLADIPGGGQGSATSIVRGDLQGSYDLQASYTGVLDPVGRSVLLIGKTANPLKGGARRGADDRRRRRRRGDQRALPRAHRPPEHHQRARSHRRVQPRRPALPDQRIQLHLPTAGTARTGDGRSRARRDVLDRLLRPDPAVDRHAQRRRIVRVPRRQSRRPGPAHDDPVAPTPTPPLAITGSALPGAAHLSWAAVSGATDYEIFTTPDPTIAFGDVPAAIIAAGTTTATISAPPNVPTSTR